MLPKAINLVNGLIFIIDLILERLCQVVLMPLKGM